MLDQDTIEQQKALLNQHRRRLALLFQQQARLGDYAPPHILLEIEDTQTAIRELKESLFTAGIAIEDEPNDDARPTAVATPSHLTPQERRNRSRMLQKVRDFWIKGVLENSLHNEVLIALNMEERPDAVQHPWDMVIQQPDLSTHKIQPSTTISEIFDQSGGELLILGAPGSGKTTILLELARDLLERAEKDDTYPMPVVFNLSSWAERRKLLSEWLIDELNTKYDVPQKIGNAWTEAEQVLLLLDGLDEVKEEHREACATTINSFRQNHGLVNLVVCSRLADYQVLTERLKLQGAILIHPLTIEQIDAYLASTGDQLTALRTALLEDVALRELAQAPLMLSIMTLAYRGVKTDMLPSGSIVEDQRQRLFDAYVERMFSRRSVPAQYTREQTVGWLARLALGMMRQGQSVFLIERLQPEWLPTPAQNWWYTTIDRASTALVGALLVSILNFLVSWQPYGLLLLTAALIGGLFGGQVTSFIGTPKTFPRLMIAALVGALTIGLIDGVGYGVDRWLSAQQRLPQSGQVLPGVPTGFDPMWEPAFDGLSVALSMMLVGGVVGLLGGLPSVQPRRIAIVEQLGWSWGKALRAAPIGMFVGLTISGMSDLLRLSMGGVSFYLPRYLWTGLLVPALVVGLIFGLAGGLVGGEIGTNTRPNQGIRRSIRNALVVGPLVAVSLYVLLFVMSVMRWYSSMPITYVALYGLIVGLALGGYAALSHLALRLVLWRSGSIPWNYARFLNYSAERIFLRKVGGGYIFIHRMLMEYFASLDTTHSNDAEQK